MTRWRSLPAWSAALALGACTAGEPMGPAASPPPQLEELSSGPFRDTLELLRSIERGSFARRAGLQDEIRKATLPDPVTVHFVSGTEVPDAQQDELRALAERLAADPRLGVDLVGCSDPSGSASLNLRISQARAESVAARLLELGVAEGQLGEVVGRGEECAQQQRMVRATPVLTDVERGDARPDAAEAGDEA